MAIAFDSDAFEHELYEATAACNRLMAANCAAEPFYGFALYVDSYYTDCGVYYNTEANYHETLEQYLSGQFGEKYRTEKRARWELRWNPGDWHYSSHWPNPVELPDLLAVWRREYYPHSQAEEHHSGDDREEYGTNLMRSACRVLARLDRDGAIDILPRTKGFRALLIDHDEPHIYSYLRYARYQTDGSVLDFGKEGQIDADIELDRVLADFEG